jgi:hypothetical protein
LSSLEADEGATSWATTTTTLRRQHSGWYKLVLVTWWFVESKNVTNFKSGLLIGNPRDV